MKTLVTGADGQVGRALLERRGEDATLLTCSRSDLDITDAAAVSEYLRRHRPDAVVNCAAYTAVDRAESEPEIAARVNTQGPRHLALAAREVGARLVHVSTDFVFDGTASAPYRPDSPTGPLSTYGRTKREGELAVLQVLPDRSLVLRTSWVYASEGRNFLLTMLRLMRANGTVRVVSDQIGTPTSAKSVAAMIWKILAVPELAGIHHWTDAGVASWYDFAVAIAEEGATLGLLPRDVSVVPIGTEQYPTPARRPQYSVLDKSSLLGVGVPHIHWRAALREVLLEIRNA